jgi:hypothetical protein
LRKDRTRDRNNYFQERQSSNRLENRNAQGGFRLDGDLVPEVAVRAMRVIRGIGVMPVADDACGKDQQRDQRQGDPEYANRLPHDYCGGTETRYNPLVIVT